MEENGCGITALSIILSAYGQEYTPEYLRKKYYPVMNCDTLPSELSSVYGIENSGFCYSKESFSNQKIETATAHSYLGTNDFDQSFYD